MTIPEGRCATGQLVPDEPAAAALLNGLRASGSSISFAVHGPERPLSPDDEATVRTLLRELLAGADGAGALSISFTWSPRHLDVLVVLGPPSAPATPRCVLVSEEQLTTSRELVQAAGGTLRIDLPRAGGAVVAATLPVLGPAEGSAGPGSSTQVPLPGNRSLLRPQ